MKDKINQRAVLIIMDGFGIAPPSAGNAVTQAKTPNLDALFATFPHSRLQASGLDVGLPDGQMGNSEVGHTNIGAGRVVFQILPKITKEIAEGSFFKNPVYLKAIHNAADHNRALHVLGLLSDGGVHSHLEHIFAMLDMAKREGVGRVYVHCFLDGRDVPPTSSRKSATVSAMPPLRPSRAGSGEWTEISAGIVWKRAIMPLSAVKEFPVRMPLLQ